MPRTVLYDEHVGLGAKMTEFHGWEMPLYYTSILEEHQLVRSAAGLFDISHMGTIWVRGDGALATLNALFVSDLEQVGEGRACYTLMVNERGGILDDVIIYRVGGREYLVVVNCATRLRDYEWMVAHRQGTVDVEDRSSSRSILAVQGPRAIKVLEAVFGVRAGGLGRFDVAPFAVTGDQAWMARTGYTGGDGFELFLPSSQAGSVWRRFVESGRELGLRPAGLGARDTLRLEAGLRLYGTDMDEQTSPYEADLGWTVALRKGPFIGQEALRQQKASGVGRKLTGLEIGEGPVPRQGCPILVEGQAVGTVTSGTYSPLLKKAIGMGYVPREIAQPGRACAVVIRGKAWPGTLAELPFWHASGIASGGSPLGTSPVASPKRS